MMAAISWVDIPHNLLTWTIQNCSSFCKQTNGLRYPDGLEAPAPVGFQHRQHHRNAAPVTLCLRSHEVPKNLEERDIQEAFEDIGRVVKCEAQRWGKVSHLRLRCFQGWQRLESCVENPLREFDVETDGCIVSSKNPRRILLCFVLMISYILQI